MFQDIYSEKQQAATTRQDSEGVRREVFFCQTLCFSLHGHLQSLVHHHLHFWTVYLQFKRKYVPFKLSYICHISYNL